MKNACHLTVCEPRKAEQEIIARVQLVAFPEVVQILTTKLSSGTDKESAKRALKRAGESIYQLNPQMEEGLLRVGGQLINAPDVSYELKHPVILPYKHHVTGLIVKQHHENVGHMGQESVLASLREKFWIVKGRSAVRRTLQRCIDCQRRNSRVGEQFMADLPRNRITPDKPPFTYVGIDYFGPPSASHMGGAWERMIRSVRQILKAILKEQLVSDEVLSTVMAEVVNILNARPLTRNSDSPMDEQPLTPNHLLHLHPCPSLPPAVFEKDDLDSERAWKQAQYLASVFWRRWTREYIPTLLERRKWNMPKRNMKVGDLVLLADETYPRGQWPLARVLEIVTSKDGYVRTVKIKTSSTVATRSRRQRKGEC